MDNRYGWIARFKQELDKLDENQIDYEQVLQLKILRKKWDEKTKPILHELTLADGESILINLKDEIVLDFLSFIHDYIKTNNIPLHGINITKRRTTKGSLHLNVLYDNSHIKPTGTFGLKQAINDVSPVVIISEMIGMDVRKHAWATQSMYNAFQKAKEEHPDWLVKYCSPITHALDLIKEYSEKELVEDW